MNVLLNRIDAQKILDTQIVQSQEAIYLTDTVPAASTKSAAVAISNYGHFFCHHITMNFTTMETVGGVPTDTGIDYLRGKLIDGKNMTPLFNDYIPLGLWSSPGRRQNLAAGPVSFPMGIIFPFEYMFEINGSIFMDVKNDSTLQANSYSMVFWGIRVKSSSSTSGI